MSMVDKFMNKYVTRKLLNKLLIVKDSVKPLNDTSLRLIALFEITRHILMAHVL